MTQNDNYLALTDEYMKQRSSGRIPDMITWDMHFCMEQQAQRLSEHGIVMREEYEFNDEAIKGSVESSRRNNSTPFSGFTAYRETVRTTDFFRNGEDVLYRREPVTFYTVIVDKEGSEDIAVNCPNCGAVTMASQLQKGCPYCGTHFEMSELFPRISSCFSVKGIVERIGLEGRLKKSFTGIACACFVLLLIFLFIMDGNGSDLPVVWLILRNVFWAALMSGVLTFMAYMSYSMFLLGKLFAEAGKVLPMLGANISQKRLKAEMEKRDPFFFLKIFEGKLVSLLQAVLYSRDRDDLSIYEGKGDLSAFDGLLDMDYRGAFKLRDFGLRNGRISVLLEVFTENIYAGKRLKRRREQILVRMERSADAVTDTGFSIHAVKCRSCGGSFDAMHVRNCPYCGNEYHAAESDWVITEIRKK